MLHKIIIGDPVVIDVRQLSLSRAVRAGDFVFLTRQVPMQNGAPMTTGTIEDQTHTVTRDIHTTLDLAGCTLRDVVKSMVWLRQRSDFSGFDDVYSTYFPHDPPACSAVVCDLLVDVRVELEVVAYRPQEPQNP